MTLATTMCLDYVLVLTHLERLVTVSVKTALFLPLTIK
jgi:hypothetical protein